MTRNTSQRRGANLWAALAAGAVVAGSLLGWAGTAAAATGTPRLVLAAHHEHGAAVQLVAHLSEPAGSSARPGGVKVTFALHLTEFAGSPLLVLGTSTTGPGGVARLVYRPTWKGPQHLVASVEDASGSTVASASDTYVATASVAPFAGATEAARPDGSIGKVVVGVLVSIVIVLWIALVTVAVRARRMAGGHAA